MGECGMLCSVLRQRRKTLHKNHSIYRASITGWYCPITDIFGIILSDIRQFIGFIYACPAEGAPALSAADVEA